MGRRTAPGNRARPGEQEDTINDRETHSDYVRQFYREGDRLLSGHVVGFRQAGVRLIADIELVGSPEELADLGQALVDRFRVRQYALAVGNLSEGFTFHGPTSSGEPAAENKIYNLVDQDFEFVTLQPLAATPARDDSSASPDPDAA